MERDNSLTDREIKQLMTDPNGNPLKKFAGVFTTEELNSVEPENKVYIILIHPKKEDVGHWVLVSAINPTTVLYFDPFGISPPESALQFMRRFRYRNRKRLMYYNTSQIQDEDSTNCGWYCCYMARMFIRKHKFLDLIENFDEGFRAWKNDILMDKMRKAGRIAGGGFDW